MVVISRFYFLFFRVVNTFIIERWVLREVVGITLYVGGDLVYFLEGRLVEVKEIYVRIFRFGFFF